MTAFGVDEAWQRLSPAEMRAAGKTFAVGYVSEDAAKNLTRAEVGAYHAAGIGVLLVYEYSTRAAEMGAAGGVSNATLAIRQAEALGYPQGCAIAFAVDEGSPNVSALASYARTFTDTCRRARYRSMVYGGLATVRYCLDHALVDLAWQTYAWSGGAWDGRAAIRQVRNGVTIAGCDVDLDTAVVADFGAWMPNMSPSGGEDMPLTPADVNLIVAGIANELAKAGSQLNLQGSAVAWEYARGGTASVPGSTPPTPLSTLGMLTGTFLASQHIQELVAAADTRDAALLAAIQALASGKTSIDTAAVIDAVNAAADKESQTVATLQQQVADLQAKLAAAGHALDSSTP